MCLDGNDYQQENIIYVISSINHRIYPQRVLKSTLSPVDDKRCYESKIESIP